MNNLYVGTENLYELLGISETGTLAEIKQSYKQLALKYHPDVSPPERIEEHTKRFIQVKEAYETLSDPVSRALYDKQLAFSSRKRLHCKEVACSISDYSTFFIYIKNYILLIMDFQELDEKESGGSNGSLN